MKRIKYIFKRFLAALTDKLRPAGHRKGKILILSAVLIIISAMFIVIMNKIQPVVEQMADSRVANIAEQAINQAITTQIVENNIDYDDIIVFEKDSTGQITALKTNTAKVNTLKSLIERSVMDELAAVDYTQLRIPIGNVFGSSILSGRGPSIKVKLIPIGRTNVDFLSCFTSAGINQTYHKISVEVRVEISAVLLGTNTQTNVSSEAVIAETVIVGSIPDSVTIIGSEENNISEKYSLIN